MGAAEVPPMGRSVPSMGEHGVAWEKMGVNNSLEIKLAILWIAVAGRSAPSFRRRRGACDRPDGDCLIVKGEAARRSPPGRGAGSMAGRFDASGRRAARGRHAGGPCGRSPFLRNVIGSRSPPCADGRRSPLSAGTARLGIGRLAQRGDVAARQARRHFDRPLANHQFAMVVDRDPRRL